MNIIINNALIISGILTIPILLIVFIRNPKNSLNLSFSAFLLTVCVWAFAIAFFRMAQTQESALFWDRIIYISGTVVPSLIFYLAHVLAEKKPPHLLIQIIEIIISFVFLFLLLGTNQWINKIILNNEGNSVVLGPIYIFWTIYLAGVYGTALAILIKNLITATGFDKIQIKYVLFASMLPMVIGIVPNIIMPLLGNYKFVFIGPFVNLVMALIITYAILKHRFLDIHFLIARSISYALLLLILAIGYMGGLILLSSYFIKIQASNLNLIILTLMSLVTAYIFQPLKELLERATDKIFYKSHYDSQKFLHSLSQTMATVPTLSNLTYKLLEVITSQMRISKAFFAIIRHNKLYIVESSKQENKLDFTQNEVERLQSENCALVIDEIPDGKTKELMRKNNISLIFPLRTRESFIGLLLLGSKKSGETFFSQDVNVLEIVGPEMAVALQNAQRFEEISQFNATLQEEVKVETKDLTDANNKLKKLDQIKDEFISIASHDLRSPLATTKGFVWMAIKDIGKSSPKAKNHLETALESTERSISLVNDMLDVSRIEAGRIELDNVKIDLNKIVGEVKEETEILASNKNIIVNIKSNGKVFAKGDEDRIHQVLSNLIGNAIKFSNEGKDIDITFKDDGKFIETSVIDHGIGIKEEDFKKLFIKFGRLENNPSSVPTITGTGLGLYICKNIIELSGGKIWVTSKYGQGSIFTFTLPKV